jgi:cobalt-zinc-cadmium efflux system membrane fusion protein
VVTRDAVVGRTASPGAVLLEVADLSVMWAELDIPESSSTAVRTGQRVQLRFEGLTDAPIETAIARVGTTIEPATRTVHARVELPNPTRSLKAGLFLRARVDVAAEHDAVVVPRIAVQRAKGRDLVFVKKEDGLYQPVAVRVADDGLDTVEILEGLEPGAEVVTSGAFLLKTEILKESIGAGCCDGDE